MEKSEIILKWAELILQGQVLAFFLALLGFLLWKKEISNLINAIATRGGKFTAGPVSGEIAASLADETKPSQPQTTSKQKTDKPQQEQENEIHQLALKFDLVKHEGPAARRSFVETLRKNQSNNFEWNVLKGFLDHEIQSVRFVASSLLTNCAYEIDAIYISKKLSLESSSLVRYRYLDSISSWLTTENATRDKITAVGEKLSIHEEENIYVAKKLESLKNLILQKN